MKTVSFIGSDKNAGKTTAMNFILSNEKNYYCVSSIGLNGETHDNLTGSCKPTIEIKKGHYFLTASEHLNHLSGYYRLIKLLSPPKYFKNYIFGQTLHDIKMVLEGPNEKESWIDAKNIMEPFLTKGTLYIDGSIDRQFIAHPEISDSFFFCLLLSARKDQMEKAADLLKPLRYTTCNTGLAKILKNINARSIVLNKQQKPIYLGNNIPFMDDDLFSCLKKNHGASVYLEGALTRNLYRKLESVGVVSIILNNFTLYQNIGTNLNHKIEISLLHPIKLNRIFVKEESAIEFEIPITIPITNLFRDNLHEVAV